MADSASHTQRLEPVWATLRYATRGLFAGLLLAALELWFVRESLLRAFPIPGLQLRLGAHITALLLLLLLPMGVAAGWLVRLSHWLLAKDKERLAGALWAIVFSPLTAWISFSLFLGGKMQRIPFHSLWSAVLFGLSLIFITQLTPRWLRFWESALQRTVRPRLSLAFGLGALLVALHLADLRILPRLYPWFHGTLVIGKILCAGLLASLPCATPPRRLFFYYGMLSLCLLAMWQGARSADKLRRAMALRTFVLEDTVLPSRLLTLLPKRQKASQPRVISDDGEQAPSYHGPRLTGRDVFLITIDALRHDELSPTRTPTLHQLAQRGISFSRAYTQVPHTSFAVATLLTGKPVYALLQLGHDAGSHNTLPLILRNYRYKTAAFYPPSVFFVEHDRLQALEESAYGFEYVKVEYLAGEKRTQQVIDFLETEKPQQVFAWIHYLEPHEPYDVHPGGPDESRSDRERYDGEVGFVDSQVARLTEYLQKHRPGALLIFAADHGEEFGEHGGRYHGTTLFDEQARVPLFVVDTADPSLLSPKQYAQPVGLIDVGPTLLGLLDVEPPHMMRGLNLAPWILSKQDKLPQRAIWSEIGKRKMVVYGDHKLICDLQNDSCQVFDLASDPEEKNNLAEADPRRTTELRGRLLGLLEEARKFEQAGTNKSHSESLLSAESANILSRARIGDRSVALPLLSLITEHAAAVEVRREATALAAQLLSQSIPIAKGEDDPAATLLPERATALAAVFDRLLATDLQPEERRWIAVLLTRLGIPHRTSPEVLRELIRDEKAPAAQRLAAALSQYRDPDCRGKRRQDCVSDALRVLDCALAMDDPDQVRPLLRLLGQSHDGRALAPLVRNLSTVRSRVDVVAALGSLGDVRATESLCETLVSDPYVHVRTQAAVALSQMGGEKAHSCLAKALHTEREEAVQAVLRKVK